MTSRTAREGLDLGLAALLFHLVLIQPNHPDALAWEALRVFPLELPAILFALLAVGSDRASVLLRVILVVVLSLLALLKTADIVSYSALSRNFDPVSDLPLVAAFARLLSGTLGAPLAIVAALGAVVGIASLVWLLWLGSGVWARVSLPAPARGASALAATLAAGVAAAQTGDATGRWSLPVDPPGTTFTTQLAIERAVSGRRTMAELRAFCAEAREDPFAGTTGLLGLIDRDVLVIFVESYGRTSHDTPFYAGLHRQTLARYQDRLAALGLSMRSGFLSAPTRGGQSWLSHATVANGLWIDDQTRYNAILASGRDTLFHLASRSGFETAAVMPQITLDWPEADRMGFDTVLAAADLGYRGQPFNWVTMPDQFTLAALDRLLRNNGDTAEGGKRLFAQIALASSHAPWVPVPRIVPWEAIGDGRIFDDIAASGDPPEIVWRDRDRVREQYRLAVDYALAAVLEYAARHAEAPPLMIVLGDHQAVEWVALDNRPDTPLHIIGPARLVNRLADIAPHRGLTPGADLPPVPMDRLRDVILEAYTVRDEPWASN